MKVWSCVPWGMSDCDSGPPDSGPWDLISDSGGDISSIEGVVSGFSSWECDCKRVRGVMERSNGYGELPGLLPRDSSGPAVTLVVVPLAASSQHLPPLLGALCPPPV